MRQSSSQPCLVSSKSVVTSRMYPSPYLACLPMAVFLLSWLRGRMHSSEPSTTHTLSPSTAVQHDIACALRRVDPGAR